MDSDHGRKKVLGLGEVAGADDSELSRLIPPERRQHRVLWGFNAESEVRQLLEGKSLEKGVIDEIMARWRDAAALVRTLPPLSGEPEVRPILDPDLLLHVAKVMERPECKQAFPDGSWSVSLVELAGIVAFQPNVDVQYADKQGDGLLEPSDLSSAVNLAFPLSKPIPLAVSVDQPQKAITISGINPTLQVVGFHCGQQDPQGPFVVSLYIGTGPNLIQVTRYRGRFFLTNGYHRAYRLMMAGFKHIPCIVRNVATFAETGALGPGFFSESVLMAQRPPIFTDFGDEVLGIRVPLHAVKKVVRIRPDEYLVLG